MRLGKHSGPPRQLRGPLTGPPGRRVLSPILGSPYRESPQYRRHPPEEALGRDQFHHLVPVSRLGFGALLSELIEYRLGCRRLVLIARQAPVLAQGGGEAITEGAAARQGLAVQLERWLDAADRAG